MITRETHRYKDYRCPIKCREFRLRPNQSLGLDDGNWHEDLEILAFTKGSATVVCGNNDIHIVEGDIVIINPNLIHTIRTGSENARYICLIINTPFCTDNYIDIKKVRFQNLIHDDKLFDLINECYLTNPSSPNSCSEQKEQASNELAQIIMCRTVVMQILARLYYQYRLPEGTNLSDSYCHEGIRKALEFVYEESSHDISLDEIANIAGLSKYHFAREFRKATKQSFVSYFNTLRCEKAMPLLCDEKIPIAEICKRCGFSSQSYFSRVFMRTVGCSPSEYRKNNVKTK